MTRYEKLAISLPSWVAENARRAVRAGEAPSLSAYVVSALEEKMKPGDVNRLLDDILLATGGPMTEKEKRDAEVALGLVSRQPPRKPKRPAKRRSKR